MKGRYWMRVGKVCSLILWKPLKSNVVMVPIISTIAGSETYPSVENIVAQFNKRSVRTLNGNSAKISSINPSTNGVGDVVVVAIAVIDRLVGVEEGVWVVGKSMYCNNALTTRVFRIVLVRRMYKNNICVVVSV